MRRENFGKYPHMRNSQGYRSTSRYKAKPYRKFESMQLMKPLELAYTYFPPHPLPTHIFPNAELRGEN